MKKIFSSYPIFLLFILLTGFILMSNTAMATTLQTTDNKIISYTDTGSGTPLVLIHAFPTDQRLWDAQRAGLSKHFRVITLDLWGFGKSSPVDGNAVTMRDYAAEVKTLLDHLHIQQAIIGGESMGGYIALAYTQQYPDKVVGLILADTQSIADDEGAKTKRETTAAEVLANGTSKLIAGFLPKALTDDASATTRAHLQTILNEQTPTAVASALRGMALRSDTSSVLAAISLPVLVITGAKDNLVLPQQSENMHKLAKNSKLVVIADGAHLANLEQPDEWNQAVVEMFEQVL